MTRNSHDSFAKEWMQEVLSDFGCIEIEKQLASEVRKVDLFFSPHPEKLQDLSNLGLLGQMIAKPALIEPFRNPVSEWEIENCRNKVFQVKAELRREAKRKKRKLFRQDISFAWILSPTVSQQQQTSFRTEENSDWGPGIYFLADPDRTAIVAIHELPKTPETLLLRLLGRGRVQAQAIQELIRLPANHPYQSEILHHIARLQINLKLRQNKTKDIQEVIMNLSPAYDQWLEQTLAQGRGEAKVMIAVQMLKKNMSLKDIADCTGLPLETIETLRREHMS